METLKQGQSFTDTRGNTGIVNFDVNTGQRLGAGQTTTFNAPTTTPVAPVSPTIKATDLQPVAPIQLPKMMPTGAPETMPAATTNKDGTTTEAPNFASSQLDFINQEKTNLQKFQENNVLSQLQGIQSLEGKSAFEAQQQEQAGVFAKEAEYRKISDQIRTRQAQAQQEYAAINKSPMSFAARAGYESAVRAAAESEIGALNAQAQAIAGDYDMAIKTAQRAVDAKYKPVEEKLATQRAQLEAIKPLLDAEEKKQARELEYKMKLEERAYQKEREEEKEVKTLALTLAQNQAPQSISDKAFNAKSMKEIMAIPGIARYLQSPAEKLDLQLKQAQINKIANESIIAGNETSKKIAEEKLLKQAQIQGVQEDLSKINETLQNQLGIDTASSVTGLGRFFNKFKPDEKVKKAVSAFPILAPTLALTSVPQNLPAQKELTASVSNILSAGTLQTLVQAKANGATFGALSDAELALIGNSFSKLNDYAIKDKGGKITGFSATPAQVEKELLEIQRRTQNLYTSLGGFVTPNTPEGITSASSFVDEALPLITQQSLPYEL